MTDMQKIYLSLLQAALWGGDVDRIVVCGEQLNAVIRLACLLYTSPSPRDS